MADMNEHYEIVEDYQQEDATNFEVVLYVVGILMIPLVPIVMVTFLTPWSGM